MNSSDIRPGTAIVTGGARGLGLGIARRLAAEGRRVVVWDMNLADFDPGAAGFTPLLAQTVDVGDLRSVTDAFAEVEAAAESVDVLVNSAGINGPIATTWDYPPEQWDRVIRTNLTGVFNCCRTVVPHMRARGHGRIVNIASIAGKEGNPNSCAYSTSKGGVITFTKSLSKELAREGILVNCIAPTMAQTDLLKQMTPEFIAATKAKIPMGRFLEVDEVAAMVSWIASPECSFTTGFTFDLSGGRATY